MWNVIARFVYNTCIFKVFLYFRTQSLTMEITHTTILFIAVIAGEKTVHVFTQFEKEVCQ